LGNAVPLFDETGRTRGAIGSYLDITERKRAEEAQRESEWYLRSTIDGLPAHITVLDERGEIILTNKAYRDFAEQNGIEPCTVSEGANYLAVCDTASGEHSNEAESFADGIREVLSGKCRSFKLEYPCHSPGEKRWFIAHVTPFVGEGPRRVIVAHENITERKHAEMEKAILEAQNQQLHKAESLGRMAGAIAHHFNNQLYAVMGNLEMAMNDLPLGVHSNECLTEAMQAARKAADVSRLMLTYLGQTPGNDDPIDLSETCRQSLTLLNAATPRGIIVNSDFPPSGPVIRADTNQIHQILTNLITNAWESIFDNRGTIGLTIKTVSLVDIPTSKRFPIDWQPQEIAYVCLELSDTGCGISNKDIEKIFDPFFTTKFTGRGLGLPVVMGIVKAHGGGVTVESEPGRGSTFRVFLPISTEALPCRIDLSATLGALQTGKGENIPNIESGGTALLIEDDEPVRNMAKKMLTLLGYKVLDAKDGAEAVDIFQQHQDEIFFVLSDLTMPRMDGWETLTALRRLSPDIPVVLSSGYDEAQVMAGDHTEQPNAFLGKPYQLKGLRETINRVLADHE
jgi:signal transduction histidine kinase